MFNYQFSPESSLWVLRLNQPQSSPGCGGREFVLY